MAEEVIRKKHTRRKVWRDQVEIVYESDGLYLELDAQYIAALVGQAVYDLHRESIKAGVEASTGAHHPPLKGNQNRRQIAAGVREDKRGMTQHKRFLSEFRADKSMSRRLEGKTRKKTKKGTTVVRAFSRMGAPDFYDMFLMSEAGRGVYYYHEEGRVAIAVVKQVDKYLQGLEVKD